MCGQEQQVFSLIQIFCKVEKLHLDRFLGPAEENPFIFCLILLTPSEAYCLLLQGHCQVQHQVPRSLRLSDTYAIERCESQR